MLYSVGNSTDLPVVGSSSISGTHTSLKHPVKEFSTITFVDPIGHVKGIISGQGSGGGSGVGVGVGMGVSVGVGVGVLPGTHLRY